MSGIFGVEFSQFEAGGNLVTGDTVVGLRNGLNTQFTFTGTVATSSAVVNVITQALHGFVVGQIVRYNGTQWVLAQADTAVDAEVIGIVTIINDANTFTLLSCGFVDVLSGLTPGATYFLSDTLAGDLTTLEPTTVNTISKPLLIATSSTTGFFFNFRGKVVPGSSINNITFVTNTDETGVFPNSQPLSTLSTGIAQVTTGTGIISTIPLNDGQVIIGATGGAPLAASLTAGSGITVTPGANSITIATTGGGSGTQLYAVDTGIINAYVVSLSTPPLAYTAGMIVNFITANTNTSDSTIDVNGLGPQNISLNGSTTFVGGEITAGQVESLIYDGTNFAIVSNISALPLLSQTYAVDSGVADAYVLTLSPAMSALPHTVPNGTIISFVPANNSTGGPCTVTLPGHAPYALYTYGNNNPNPNDLNTGKIAVIVYDTAAGGFLLLTIPTYTDGTQIYAVDTGIADAYIADIFPNYSFLLNDGSTINFKAINNNTGASTLTVLGNTHDLVNFQGNALVSGDILAGNIYSAIYNLTTNKYQLVSPTPSAFVGILPLANGGTNADLSLAVSDGGIVYSTATAFGILAGTATANQVLLSGSNTTPSWSTATYPVSTTINRLLYSSSNNVITDLATVNSAALTTNATGVPTWLALTDGQIVIGSSIGAPLAATITAGAGISIANGNNTITITNTGVGASWVDQTSTPVTMAANTAYVANTAGLLTFNMPALVAFGTIFEIAGQGAGGWLIQLAGGQTANSSAGSTTVAGTLASTNRYDCITLLCTVANTTFTVIDSEGAITNA